MRRLEPMRNVTVVALALAALAPLTPTGAAVADACILDQAPARTLGLTLFGVASTLGVLQPRPDCGSSVVFHSFAPACPATMPLLPVPGAYCGPMVPPGGAARCQWLPLLTGVTTRLFAGFDTNGDGHVRLDANEVVFGPLDPLPSQYVLANPGPGPARVIAYPTNMVNQDQRTQDLSLVGCVET